MCRSSLMTGLFETHRPCFLTPSSSSCLRDVYHWAFVPRIVSDGIQSWILRARFHAHARRGEVGASESIVLILARGSRKA